MPAVSNTLLAYIKSEDGKSLAVYPALKNRTRPAGVGHPEEAVRVECYNKLLTHYGYPAELIDIEFPVIIREDEAPRYADIVVFDDKEHKRPFIVIECKRPTQQDGERQGQRYATILRAVYVWWTNGTDESFSVIANRYPEQAVPINHIPPFVGQPQYTVIQLKAFKDDKHLSDTVRKCHKLIRNLCDHKPDAAFNEFLKLLLVKFNDELKDSGYEFQVFLRGEPPTPEPTNETAQRVRLLFKLSVENQSEISTIFEEEDDIALTNDCISQITAALQQFSFSATEVDQKGRAFESFLSGDLRQEFKEFMTPRPVVEAVIQMAQPEGSDSILDPCCGSGAFLTYSLAHIRREYESRNLSQHQKIKAVFDFAHDRLWGFDVSPQMTAVARVSMLINEDGRTHIYKYNSLYLRKFAPPTVREKTFDLILTNPPFGKRITQPSELLEGFEVTKNARGRVKKGGFLT